MKRLRYVFIFFFGVSFVSAQQDAPLKTALNQNNNTQTSAVTPGSSVTASPQQTNTILPPGWQQDQKPGNYQKKAQAFKKAGELYDQIRKIEPILQKLREAFFSQKAKINKKMRTFFSDMGANQNELEDEINDLIQQLNQDVDEDGELTEEEREIQQEANQNKTDLKQLNQNITVLGEFSSALDTALAQFDNQVNLLQKFEDQAWTNYQKIDEIFDDQQAAQLVDQINVMLANAQAIQTYIQGPFTQFFSSTSDTIDAQMQKITSVIKTLEDRGIQLLKQSQQIDAAEDAARLAQEEAAKKAAEEKRQAEQSKTFIGRFKNVIGTIWNWMRGVVSDIYKMIFPGKAKKKLETEQPLSQKETLEQPAAPNAQIPSSPQAAPPAQSLSPVNIPKLSQPQPLPQPPGQNAG